MVKSPFIIIAAILLSAISSCGEQQSADALIASLDGKDFSGMKGFYVHYRSRGSQPGSSILFVGKYGLNCSPYVVDMMAKDDYVEFISIDNESAIKSCGYDYIYESQVKEQVKNFLSFGVTLLGVDTFGNVYINPSSQDIATLIKVNDLTKVSNSALYKPYKGDWYIRE